jgi:glycosyltransferase involved in cell wall biosynthesis
MIVTDMMSDHLVRIVPRCITTTFGTPAFVDEARAAGHRHAELLLPPVDVNENAPGTVSSQALRKIYQIGPSEVVLVTVSRLVSELKGDSLRGTIEAVRILGRDLPIRLILVGDGNLKLELENQAAKVNAELGRSAVILAGAMVDPRPAYAAADICIGMGGSALRGMAFGKPTIIVGSAGFAAPFTPATATSFYYGGIYGIGENVHGAEQLVEHIRALIVNGSELATLGEFSRQFVVRHFSLDAVSVNLERQCRAAAKSNWLAAAGEALRLALILAYPRVVPSRLRQQLKRVIQFGGAASGVLRWGSKPARVDLGECHRDDTNRDRTS